MPLLHQCDPWCRDTNDTGEFGNPCSWFTEGLQQQRDDAGASARGSGAELVTTLFQNVSYIPLLFA
jgi:hypothetical protein